MRSLSSQLSLLPLYKRIPNCFCALYWEGGSLLPLFTHALAPQSVEALRSSLSALSLDSRGHKDVLARRLARAQKSRKASASVMKLPKTRPQDQTFDSYLCLDVEATCERIEGPYSKLAFGYPNEIIELPVLLLQWRRAQPQRSSSKNSSDSGSSDGSEESVEGQELDEEEAEQDDDDWKLEVVDEFHTFVRPTWKPTLSTFCTELTGITQEQVDAAPTYAEVLDIFYEDFILKHNLFTRTNKTVWCSDGPWDLRDFIAKATHISGVPRPTWLAGNMIDVRSLTSHFFSSLKHPPRTHETPPSPPLSSSPDAHLSISPSSEYSLPSTPIPPSFLTSHMTHSVSTSAIPSSIILPPTPPTSPPPPNSSLTAPASMSIPFVLLALHLSPFEGRLHSGLCDARNLTRILIELARRGVSLQANRVVPEGGRGGRERRWGWMGRGGIVDWEGFKEREERKMAASPPVPLSRYRQR